MKSKPKKMTIKTAPVPAPGDMRVSLRPEIAEARFANVIGITREDDAIYFDFLSRRANELVVVSRIAVTHRVALQLRDLISEFVHENNKSATQASKANRTLKRIGRVASI